VNAELLIRASKYYLIQNRFPITVYALCIYDIIICIMWFKMYLKKDRYQHVISMVYAHNEIALLIFHT